MISFSPKPRLNSSAQKAANRRRRQLISSCFLLVFFGYALGVYRFFSRRLPSGEETKMENDDVDNGNHENPHHGVDFNANNANANVHPPNNANANAIDNNNNNNNNNPPPALSLTESIYSDYFSKTGDLLVPQFHSSPLPVSLPTPSSLKSYARPPGFDPNDLEGEMEDATIFLMIASYRDYECPITVTDALTRASNPSRVHIGVVQQNTASGTDVSCGLPPPETSDGLGPQTPCSTSTFPPDQRPMCKHSRNLKVFEGLTAELATGPVVARHVGYRLYDGQAFFMQVDAHVFFVENWDRIIIQEWQATKNEMAVLSTYLTDVVGSIDPHTHNSKRKTRPIMCNTQFEANAQGKYLRHGSQPESVPAIKGVPQLQPYWAAGFSFSRGHFPIQVPYDPYLPMIFQGEEISIGVRGFTHGYDFYAPEKSVNFHVYAQGENKVKRKNVKSFWENSKAHAGMGKLAMSRLLAIVGMVPDTEDYDRVEEDVYGTGSVRTAEMFYKIFGIEVVQKKTKKKLCDFVSSGNMHREFHEKHLRLDGIGIDYNKIGADFAIPAFLGQQ